MQSLSKNGVTFEGLASSKRQLRCNPFPLTVELSGLSTGESWLGWIYIVVVGEWVGDVEKVNFWV